MSDLLPMQPREDSEYAIVIPYQQVCELIRGTVPHDVMVACISGIRAIHTTPAESIERNRIEHERKRKKASAA